MNIQLTLANILFALTLILTGCGGGGGGGGGGGETTAIAPSPNDSGGTPTSSTTRITGWGTPPTLVAPTTNEEAKQMLDLSAQISDEFMSDMRVLRETMDANTATQRAVDNLKNNPNVVAVEYKYKSLRIYTILGDKAYILLDAHHREKPGLSATSLNFPSITRSLIHKSSNDIFPQSLNTITAQSVSPAGRYKALILSGYQWDFGDDLCPIKFALENSGFSVDFVVDIKMCADALVKTFDQRIFTDYISRLHEYDVIYINTHGNTDLLLTGIPYNFNLLSGALLDAWKRKEVALCTTVKDGPSYICIKDTYISNHFTGTKKFKNALVLIDACHSAEVKEELPDAFLGSGAAVYIGYDDTIRSVETREFTTPFFNRITRVGISVAKALEQAAFEEQLKTDWLHSNDDCDPVCDWIVVVKNYKTKAVHDDPEGFILIPMVPMKNSRPTAQIRKPTDGSKFSIGEQVSFKGRGTDKDGSVESYQWFFGNGESTDAVSNSDTVYAYEKAGSYRVRLRVKDNEEGTDEASIKISVTRPDNQKPTAYIDSITGPDGNTIYYAKDTITFKGSGTDPEGQPITKYTWSFGDGDRHYYGQTVTNRYSKSGTYQVKLWVSDGEKTSVENEDNVRKIEVLEALTKVNQPPTIDKLTGPKTAKVNETVRVNFTFSDPDSISDIKVARLRTSENGTHNLATAGNVRITKNGSYGMPFKTARNDHWIELYLEDSAGNSDVKKHYFNVEALPPVNQPPTVINITGPKTAEVNKNIQFNYTYSDLNGLSDIRSYHLRTSENDNRDLVPKSTLAGTTTTGSWVVMFKTPRANHWIEMYIVDSAGHKSNTKRHNINIEALPPVVQPPTVVNRPPVVSNLKASTEFVSVDQDFNISYNYSDPDGLSDVRYHIFRMSDNNSATRIPVQPPATGYAKIPGFSFATQKSHWIDVYMQDSAGNISQPVRVTVEVMLPMRWPTENKPPSILRLNVPSTVAVEERFTISFDYSDPDGVSDVRTYHLLMSDSDSISRPDQGTGHTQPQLNFYFKKSGLEWVEVYIVDSAGNRSQTVRKNINVGGTSGGGGSGSGGGCC